MYSLTFASPLTGSRPDRTWLRVSSRHLLYARRPRSCPRLALLRNPRRADTSCRCQAAMGHHSGTSERPEWCSRRALAPAPHSCLWTRNAPLAASPSGLRGARQRRLDSVTSDSCEQSGTNSASGWESTSCSSSMVRARGVRALASHAFSHSNWCSGWSSASVRPGGCVGSIPVGLYRHLWGPPYPYI